MILRAIDLNDFHGFFGHSFHVCLLSLTRRFRVSSHELLKGKGAKL